MMAHHNISGDSTNYPPPFSLDGGLLASLHFKLPRVEDDSSITSNSGDEDTKDAAMILTALSSIASKEDPSSVDSSDSSSNYSYDKCFDSPRFSHLCSIFEEEYQHEMELEKVQEQNRIRAVSISHPEDLSSGHVHVDECDDSFVGMSIISTPPHSPVAKCRKPRMCRDKNNHVAIVSPGNSQRNLLQQSVTANNGQIKTILRRKFSWKNYPELEAFLIANREEYLRHSALNYTIQQKQYNNRLTERLLELASKHGYVFDEDAFSFVTVRDRIRCYYKSYVQSSKKRGVIIGYAARRAGLLSKDELEKSAGIAGRIVVPDL